MSELTCFGYETDELKVRAEHLASQLNLKLEKDCQQGLFLGVEGLGLKMAGFNLLSADFSTATWNKRKNEGKKQGLVRACKPAPKVKIIDATAGWGRDSAVLASFGAEVLMIERNVIMASLLADALERRTALEQEQMNLSLHQGNALTYLNALSPQDYPDIIYIDPMHPARTKSALVKKDMQALQDLIGPDEDALALIEMAIQRTKNKVVVKWPQKIKSLLPTSTCIDGKTVRFDIYGKCSG